MMHLVVMMVALAADWPAGPTPEPVAIPHFPDRLHAFVWRNWELVPVERMAKTLQATPDDIKRLAAAMGLPEQPVITEEVQQRSYITVIRRNWHLLPYPQLLDLLGWTKERLVYTLREDDFLYAKLGMLKPNCPPLVYAPPNEAALARDKAVAAVVKNQFPDGIAAKGEPLFAFVKNLSALPNSQSARPKSPSRFSPRFCASYFALYGDPLADDATSPFPDGYLARLANSGADGVWLQGVLYKLAPFPWDPAMSEGYERRLDVLRRLVARAKSHGIGVYLYLNEPRAMPVAFYEKHPDLRGVTESDYAAMCTSAPEVQKYITDSVASVCKAVPDLAGFFTITASENLTNCWSHYNGKSCPRCGKRTPAEVIAEVNGLVQRGIAQSGTAAKLIAWDWGWGDDWSEAAIAALPKEAALMSVSEWSIPFHRGGIDAVVGEYSISVIGPGPRATSHWAAARARGLKTIAKIQANNTWELSSVPYIPALENVAQHASRLRDAHVDGLMLGWSLGGYPSPNLEVVAEIGATDATADGAMETVAARRFGAMGPQVVTAWKKLSTAFSEFPYHVGMLYNAPMQYGPANLLWGAPTGYHATMVCYPYDDLAGWHGGYPPEVFAQQFTKVADGFDAALADLKKSIPADSLNAKNKEASNLISELGNAEAASIHFRSSANQVKFVLARDRVLHAKSLDEAKGDLDALESILREETKLAQRLYALQRSDSRIGFESSNQYFYVPLDLVEKVVDCQYLLDNWLPDQRTRLKG